MKKILYSAAAIALAFFSASCQQENLEPTVGGTVTYTVQVPDAIATKAIGDDIAGVTELIYEVYKEDEYGNLTAVLYESVQPEVIYNGKFTFELEFIKNHNYTVLFWAYNPNDNSYDTADLRAVELSPTLSANNEAMAVFSGSDKVRDCQSVNNGNVTLVRPVAQINIVTNDESLAVGSQSITLNQSSLTVSGLYTTYNVADKTVSEQANSIEYAIVDPDTENIPDGTFPIDSKNYHYVAMNYVGFVPELGDNVDLNLTIKTSEGDIFHEISNVPVKPNYRTNIYGNLITASSDYAVELKADWTDVTGGNMEVIADGLVKNINGDYEVTNAAGLAYAINNLFVDENGVANNKSFYVEPGIYDMAQQAINDITVKSGTLKVYDTDAVVTRSVTIDGVVITGLKKPLINTVEENATVFFSGITIQNFEGDNQDEDQNGALVGDNNGKVVLKDCNIVDKDGTNDEDNKLVGGNDPEVVEDLEEPANGLIYTAAQLSEAFADETVESIVLGADITLEETLVFPEGREAVLDLRGWTITIADPEKVATTYALNNHGTLTIMDSYQVGSVKARGIYNGYGNGDENIPDATLIIDGGTFNAMGTDGGAAVFNYGIADIKGGNFTSIGGYSLNNQAGARMTIADGVKANNGIYVSNATLTVNGGEIEGNRSGCHVVYSWNSNVTINGGTIHNNNSGNSTLMAAGTSAMTVNGGTFSIKDGRVPGNGNTWTSCLTDTQNSAAVTVNRGTFNGGFRVQAGTTMTINGGSFNDCYGSGYNIYGTLILKGGTYTDETALKFAKQYVHSDYKLVGENVVPKEYVAQIGEQKYESLQEAIEKVKDGDTVAVLKDIEFVSGANGSSNGISYTRDANFILDLNGKTVTSNLGGNALRFKIGDGNDVKNAEVTIEVKNGTVISGETNWCAISASSADNSGNKLILNLNTLNVENSKAGDYAIKSWAGAVINANNVNVTSTYGGGFYAVGGEIVLDNCTVDQKGYTSDNFSAALGVSNGSMMTVNSGTYSSISDDARGNHVAYVMTSGGNLIIKGGTFTNIGNGAIASNARASVVADANAVVTINGGTFNAQKNILWTINNLGYGTNPVAYVNGGDFSSNPCVYDGYVAPILPEGMEVAQGADGRWTVVKTQPNNEIWYTSSEKLEPTTPTALNAGIVSNIWDSTTGKGVITFDAPLNTIGNEAFKRITNETSSNWATSISLPNSVEIIGNFAFAQCYSLTNITIPDSVTSVGEYAFQSCQAAKSVTIGSGVTSISSGAFYGCWELNQIICKGITPPKIADKWVFHDIASNPTVIVPAQSVEAYKNANFWSSLNIVAE